MIYKLFRPFLFFIAFILTVGLACNTATGTTQPSPTQAIVQAPPTAKPTIQMAPFELDSTLYIHPSGAFNFYPPAGWSQEVDENGDILLISPDEIGAIYITVTNTGHILEPQAFLKFTQNVEENFFATRNQYRAGSYQSDPSTDLMFKKTFMLNNVLQEVTSYYHQEGPAIYVIDYWAELSHAPEYTQAYQNISIAYNPANVSNLPTYNFVYSFNGPKNLFSIDVPTAWQHQTSTDTNLIVDSIHAPDDHALIESIVYDDGSPYPKAEAGKATLRLLNQFYTKGAGDISVTDNRIIPDGRERLVWESKQGGFSGTTIFEVRNETTFIIFSILCDDLFKDSYLPVLEHALDSYVIPQ